MYRAADAPERTVCKRGTSEFSPQGCDEMIAGKKENGNVIPGRSSSTCAKGFKCAAPPMPRKDCVRAVQVSFRHKAAMK